jgi:hypothetical protein
MSVDSGDYFIVAGDQPMNIHIIIPLVSSSPRNRCECLRLIGLIKYRPAH